MRKISLLAVFTAALVGWAVQAAEPKPTTILIGQSWLGLWRDGKLVASREEAGWQFNAVQLSRDAKTVQVAAYRKNGRAEPITVLTFDTGHLTPGARKTDPKAAAWPPLPAPLQTDMSVPDATAPGAALVSTSVAGGTMLRLRNAQRSADSPSEFHLLPKGEWRTAISPDGSIAAAFGKPASQNAAWPGQAWNTKNGQAIPTQGLTIDDGSTRENGASRTLACLLPQGEGAIFTYLGTPADNASEYQPSGPDTSRATALKTPYVMTCLDVPVH